MTAISQYKFEPGAMSIIQMGEELIGHPSTAINELVKNAYDADADCCWVYTQYDKDPSRNFLIIKDNGLGMSKDILFGDWLRPSKSSKRDEDKEKRKSKIYDRYFLGSKGIGRLAAMALGRYLTVISKENKEDEFNWLRIDREDFRSEALLNKVSFPGGKIDDYKKLFNDSEILELNKLKPNGNLINLLSEHPFNSLQEGTLIILQDLDDSIKIIIEEEFTKKHIEETGIFKSLRDLITPLKLNSEIQDELIENGIISNKLFIDNGESTFDLKYGINFIKDRKKEIPSFIPVEPAEIIKYYDYRVFGKVDKNVNVKGKYVCKRLTEENPIIEVFEEKSAFILSDEDLKERRLKEIEDIPEKYKDVELGEFYFDIRVYDLDSDAKEKMVKLLKASGRREATKTLNKYLGLKVSKNGFGVKPYGEEEQDWLGLGAKRVQKHIVTMGPNQILGYIYLFSPQNDALNEKTNREGFFENKAFVVFKKIIGGILEEMGRRRANHRLKHNLGRTIKSKHQRPNTEEFIQYILDSSNDAALISKTQKFVSETKTALDNMEHSLSFSQRLATIGSGLELVYHELSQPITSLGASTKSIQTNATKLENIKLKDIILDRVSNVNASVDMLETLQDALLPAIGKSSPKVFKPADTFKKVCFLFNQDIAEDKTIIEIEKNTDSLEIKGLEYVFWITFLNILNNFMYWLKFTDKKRAIRFEYEAPNTLIISNTGPKIPEGNLDIIFDYGVTMRKERSATGLGLAYTRNILTTNGWNIWAENREYGPAFFIQKEDTSV